MTFQVAIKIKKYLIFHFLPALDKCFIPGTYLEHEDLVGIHKYKFMIKL